MALPLISGRECVTALAKLGYYKVSQVGSHIRLKCQGRGPVTVPAHKEINRDTLRSILRQAGLSEEEFRVLL